MSDGSARHPRSFEPPPWERERFEELARRRAESDAAEAAIGQAREEAERAAAVQEAAAAVGAAPGPGTRAEAQTVGTPTWGEVPPDAELLLIELAAEEPRALGWVWLAWLAAAGLFAVLGVGTLVFGAVGLARAQGSSVATTWSFVLVLVGLASLGAAMWLTVKALGERGA
jgi:hypothetical protein